MLLVVVGKILRNACLGSEILVYSNLADTSKWSDNIENTAFPAPSLLALPGVTRAPILNLIGLNDKVHISSNNYCRYNTVIIGSVRSTWLLC